MSKRRARNALILLLLAVGLLLGACAPSVDGEKKTWDRNNKEAAALAAAYPSFKAAIDGQQTAAQKSWEAAGKAGSDEEKAKGMKGANETLGKLVGRLNEVKYKGEGLEKTIEKLGTLKLPKADSTGRSEAMTKAREALAEVGKAMSEARPTDEATAMAVLEPIISKLISANGAAQRALKKYTKGKK